MFRSTSSNNIGRCAGVVLFSTSNEELTEVEVLAQMLEGDLGADNLTELKNALLRINAHKNSEQFKEVDIRGFIRNVRQTAKVSARMEAVKNWLKKPIAGFDEGGGEIELDKEQFPEIDNNIIVGDEPILIPEVPAVDPSNPNPEEVKIDEADKARTPSEESYNLMIDPTDQNSEFNTIEIVLLFEE